MVVRVDDEAFNNALDAWEKSASLDFLLDLRMYREHFLTEYGIHISPGIGSEFEIVDEQKYLMFIMRWS